jgi:hypothetical protein
VELDEELDRLYALPLDEFTAARNELAKRLRKESRREEADLVKALSKPSVAAWAVNQLAHRRTKRLRALLEAADALRSAQERALKGSGGDELREASQRERQLVSELRREAGQLLAEGGHAASDATLQRVATTLSSAAVDAEARPLLEAGRLSEEVEASGFDAFAGMSVPSPAARAPARERPAPKKDAKPAPSPAEERRRVADLRKQARALDKEARDAEREATRAAGAAERAEREAERAAETARRAADDAKDAADEASSARAAADDAAAEVDRAAGAPAG